MSSFTKSPMSMSALAALATAVLFTPGCSTTNRTFPMVVGASKLKSDVQPCADYASFSNYMGTPYYVVNSTTGQAVTRHEGMDFCVSTDSEVLAPANGTVIAMVSDNPFRGGRVTIQSRLTYEHDGRTQTLFVDAVHISPRAGLAIGNAVTAGQVIGYVQPPGKSEIGPRPHVHLSAGPTYQTWKTHTDPNRFWQKGPGVVSCFDPKSPPTDSQLVAPIKC
jgi:murein DD-endopeptidase MepM/ murein hydrolase activator NlpD